MRVPRIHHMRRVTGFTLLEAMMAVTILLVVVIAVTGAVTAGQQHALEARQRIAAALAAEELLGRLTAEPYDKLLGWHGYRESVGTMLDVSGKPLPDSLNLVGRSVSITTSLETVAGLDVRVRGRTVRVQSFDSDLRVLSDLSMFIPEPQS